MTENKTKSIAGQVFSIAFPIIEYWLINNLVFLFLRRMLFENDTYNMQISAAAMAFAAFWFFQRYRLEEKNVIGEKEKITWSWFFTLAMFAVIASLWINLVVLKLELAELSKRYIQTSTMQYSVSLWFGFLLYGIISPLAEELVFRGILQNRIKRALNTKVAILLSSFLFGLYHGNLVQGLYAFLIAIIFAVVYEKYNRIAIPIIFHSIINCVSFTLTYFGFMEKLLKNLWFFVMLTILNIAFIIYIIYKNRKVVKAAESGDV